MSERKYTLELTAEELEWLAPACPADMIGRQPATIKVDGKLRAVRDQARADRKADDRRVPWRAERWATDEHPRPFHLVIGTQCIGDLTERQANLAAAAPALLEAAKAMHAALVGTDSTVESERAFRLGEFAIGKAEHGLERP